MITMVILVLLVFALAGGGWGHSRYGAQSWSPAGIILLVAVIMFLTGNLRLG
jgi:hypothetical protein